MRYGDFLSSLSLASSRSGGDFPVLSSTWQWRSRSGQPAQDARPNIRVYGACAVCRRVLVRIYGGYFSGGTRDVVSKLFITSRVPINKSIRPRDEVIMMNNDETYDEIMM